MQYDDERDDDQTFAPELLTQIRRRVANGIVRLCNPEIDVPDTDDYAAGHFLVRDELKCLLVNVPIDGMMLQVHAAEEQIETAPRDGGAGLAAAIVQRVEEFARGRRGHETRLATAHEAIERKIARDGLGMRLVEVRYIAVEAESSIAGCILKMVAGIEMLNAALQPSTMWIEFWSPRELAGEINRRAANQRKRLRTVERLAGQGAALEIDAVASRVITGLGKRVDRVAANLLAMYATGGHDHFEELAFHRPGSVTAASLDNGCIVAEFDVGSRASVVGRTLVVREIIPESSATAAVGRRIDKVIDHPMLTGLATVAGAVVDAGHEQTIFDLEIPRRPIMLANIQAAAQVTVI